MLCGLWDHFFSLDLNFPILYMGMITLPSQVSLGE